MAVEATYRSYQFLDPVCYLSYGSENDDSEDDNLESVDEIGILYNYIHDLESLWWILIWTVFVYEKAPVLTDETSTKFAEAQRSSYFSLFPADLNFGRRYTFLVDRGLFKRHMKNVPPFFKGYVRTIKHLRVLLLHKYTEVEKDVSGPIRLSGPDVIHRNFLEGLSKREIEKGDIISVLNSSSLKRSSETQDDLQQPDSKRRKTIFEDTRSTETTDPSFL